MRACSALIICFFAAAVGACATFAPLPETPAPPGKGLSLRVSTSGESYLEIAPGEWRTWGPSKEALAVEARAQRRHQAARIVVADVHACLVDGRRARQQGIAFFENNDALSAFGQPQGQSASEQTASNDERVAVVGCRL